MLIITCCKCDQEYEFKLYEGDGDGEGYLLQCPNCRFVHEVVISPVAAVINPMVEVKDLMLAGGVFQDSPTGKWQDSPAGTWQKGATSPMVAAAYRSSTTYIMRRRRVLHARRVK